MAGGQRTRPVLRGLLVGQRARRRPGRGDAVAAGLAGAGVGTDEVPGQLGQGDIAAARPLGFQLGARPLVQAGPVRGGQLVVGILAEQVMREAIAVLAVPAVPGEHAGPCRGGQRLGRLLR